MNLCSSIYHKIFFQVNNGKSILTWKANLFHCRLGIGWSLTASTGTDTGEWWERLVWLKLPKIRITMQPVLIIWASLWKEIEVDRSMFCSPLCVPWLHSGIFLLPLFSLYIRPPTTFCLLRLIQVPDAEGILGDLGQWFLMGFPWTSSMSIAREFC